MSIQSPTPLTDQVKILKDNARSKFNIGDKIYCYNINMQLPLINELIVKGIIENEDGLYYTSDKSMWIKEEFLYKTKKEAYRYLIQQAETEMNQPEIPLPKNS